MMDVDQIYRLLEQLVNNLGLSIVKCKKELCHSGIYPDGGACPHCNGSGYQIKVQQ